MTDSASDSTPATAATDPLVWQGHAGSKYHREDCPLLNRPGAVTWRRSFAAADYEHGLGLEPCKRCRPDLDVVSRETVTVPLDRHTR